MEAILRQSLLEPVTLHVSVSGRVYDFKFTRRGVLSCGVGYFTRAALYKLLEFVFSLHKNVPLTKCPVLYHYKNGDKSFVHKSVLIYEIYDWVYMLTPAYIESSKIEEARQRCLNSLSFDFCVYDCNDNVVTSGIVSDRFSSNFSKIIKCMFTDTNVSRVVFQSSQTPF